MPQWISSMAGWLDKNFSSQNCCVCVQYVSLRRFIDTTALGHVMSGRFDSIQVYIQKIQYANVSSRILPFLSLPCTQQTGATTVLVAAAPVPSTTASFPPSPSVFKTFPTTHLPTGQSPVLRTLAEQGKQRQTCPQGTTT